MNMSYYLHYLKERKNRETKIAFSLFFLEKGNLFSGERNS
jgi:hypothetical protein